MEKNVEKKSVENKIDFAALATVEMANPNGDPGDLNKPRTNMNGYGLIMDVCLKRKARNRIQDKGYPVFVQSEDRSDDGAESLQERIMMDPELAEALKNLDEDSFARLACEKYMDVRMFGQLFPYKYRKENGKDAEKGISCSVRGPVTIRIAKSVDPVIISEHEIVKSVNGSISDSKSSDRMGSKYVVDFGVYVIYGSINPQLASKTGLTEEETEYLKEALMTLFENDESAARPAGSMEVRKVVWWKHNCPNGQYSTAKVHRSLHINKKEGVDIPSSYEDYDISLDQLEDLETIVVDL